MRRLATLVILIAALFLAAGAYTAAKRRAPVRVPHITAAQRAAAMKKVEANLRVPAGTVLQQPGALVPFFERLARIAPGPTPDPVHILHFGDSHTAADEWTGSLRELFQQRFGDGGSGFSLAGHPFAGYRRLDARGGATNAWHSDGLRTGVGDGYFGLGGVSISTERAGQSVFLNADCDHLEIQYLQQPDGGSLALYEDDQLLQEFSTGGELSPAYAEFQTDPGEHRFSLKTLDSHPVRLFGWVVDRPAGITYEALGINGAEAAVMLRWNQEMLATYVQRRNPGLIVLAYGANEASDPNWTPDAYQSMFSSLLEHLRAAAPAASILVVGPADRWVRYRGTWRLVPGIDFVVAAQRTACREKRCAFWDLRERMGGKQSMRDWVTAGLGQADRVHFTEAGYRRLADTLFEDLMRQFALYRKARQETDQVSHGQADPDR